MYVRCYSYVYVHRHTRTQYRFASTNFRWNFRNGIKDAQLIALSWTIIVSNTYIWMNILILVLHLISDQISSWTLFQPDFELEFYCDISIHTKWLMYWIMFNVYYTHTHTQYAQSMWNIRIFCILDISLAKHSDISISVLSHHSETWLY